MIDEEVLADVRTAEELARTSDLVTGVLDGLTWAKPTAVDALHQLAASCRGEGRWTPLLVAVDDWSHGESGHGAWRTRRITALPDLEVRLAAAVATLDAGGAVEAYYQLNNDGHVHGWGPALFSRFLQVADRTEHALALNAPLAEAGNALVPGSDLGSADWSTPEYAFHLALMHRIAAEVAQPAATVAAALAEKFSD